MWIFWLYSNRSRQWCSRSKCFHAPWKLCRPSIFDISHPEAAAWVFFFAIPCQILAQPQSDCQQATILNTTDPCLLCYTDLFWSSLQFMSTSVEKPSNHNSKPSCSHRTNLAQSSSSQTPPLLLCWLRQYLNRNLPLGTRWGTASWLLHVQTHLLSAAGMSMYMTKCGLSVFPVSQIPVQCSTLQFEVGGARASVVVNAGQCPICDIVFLPGIGHKQCPCFCGHLRQLWPCSSLMFFALPLLCLTSLSMLLSSWLLVLAPTCLWLGSDNVCPIFS